MDSAADPKHLRRPGHSMPVTPADMAGRVAHFDQLAPDRGAFPDIKDQAHARTVWYLLSPGGLAGEPSPIRAPHGFHMAIMRMPKGMRPSTHAHPYNEVFMPLDARFRFYYGDNEAHSVEVGRYGVISVPAGVMRTFENLDEHDAHVLVVFDTPGDPHTEMLITPRDYEKFYRDGWVPGVEPPDPA
jgi:quercetin dioxygenase-like cupin family protein